ncbi:clan AA aspartic protease [Aetokthonos hydrillicola Thurmond2011]|jgi:clan AA aspartic protease|uniref:Clan AA aspartic protease n=1 Tax=Aetokthonos hydrillicola Thurmond2011 TaxID=2712845 RepID=A0AAP5IC60_9CYAN|nr:clan AA aspartic protease [Aetokthonos hydrillicola]MBO3460243.1 clan AA aspartic protease [Aetokthonos hydrillicola CCALA 1050]MBW4586976.1 clan AA aspartic protease [Aetokthonos hydrillicola CCALA 1050]MDR9897549.1 clan AA aspartic protease [Aetokthonos hydrillicola Thurmond2011]
MIYGRLIDRKAIVPVIFRLSQQPDFSLTFVVDTGFNGYLTLPAQAVSALNLPLHSSTSIKLADGSEALTAIHLATVFWDNVEKVVPILASGYKPLLGAAMMEGYHLEIDFADNGLVSLEKIQS